MLSAQAILSEIGTDMSVAYRQTFHLLAGSSEQFTGGKVMRSRSRKTTRAARALRLAAQGVQIAKALSAAIIVVSERGSVRLKRLPG